MRLLKYTQPNNQLDITALVLSNIENQFETFYYF